MDKITKFWGKSIWLPSQQQPCLPGPVATPSHPCLTDDEPSRSRFKRSWHRCLSCHTPSAPNFSAGATATYVGDCPGHTLPSALLNSALCRAPRNASIALHAPVSMALSQCRIYC